MRHGKLAILLPALVGLTAAQACAQLVITPTFDSTWTSGPTADPNFSIDEGAITNLITNVYDKDFTNPLNVAIDFSDVNTGLGSSSTTFYTTDYNTYRNMLAADKDPLNGGDGNSTFLAELPASENPVPGNGNAGVDLTSAQARAIGFGSSYVGDKTVVGQTGTFDSHISLNVSVFPTMDNGAALAATAAHEINEALGLSSALDGRTDLSGTATVANVGSLDFFRYAALDNTADPAHPISTLNRSFTSDSTAISYFSDNGGTTPIVYFNQVTGGDYHDWASSGEPYEGPVRVQDAFGPVDVTPENGSAEFEALNDIGYNRAPNAVPAVPEASSLALSVLGMLPVGFLAARKRRRSA